MWKKAHKFEGYTLNDVYSTYSAEKEKAYNQCLEKYRNTQGSFDFYICSHNTFQFTVTWKGGYVDSETAVCYPAVFLETAKNSYVII